MNDYNRNEQKYYEENGYTWGHNTPYYSNNYAPDIYLNPDNASNAGVKTKSKPRLMAVVALALIFGFIGGIMGMYVQNMVFGNTNSPMSNNVLDASNQQEQSESIKTVNINNNGTFPVAAISEKVSPSVVGLRITSVARDYFYGEYESQSEGSGVVYSSDGYIITNHHVIEAAIDTQNSKIMAYLPNDMENPVEAEIIGYDISMDLALLKINKTGLVAAEFGDSDNVNIGDIAVAIGNPGGLEFMGSTSFGVISGLNRTIKLESGANLDVIQTDAAINPGNSGGALVNADGKVIGINSAKLASSGFEGMGFALPINKVVEVCERLINNKGATLPYIGIQEDPRYTSEILSQYGYPTGVVVGAVVEGGPAENAGINAGDIITKFNGVDTPNIALLNNERNKCAPGDTAVITLYRDGVEQQISIELAESMA